MNQYTALFRRIKRYQRQHMSIVDMKISGLFGRRRMTREEQTALHNRAQVLARQLDLMLAEAKS